MTATALVTGAAADPSPASRRGGRRGEARRRRLEGIHRVGRARRDPHRHVTRRPGCRPCIVASSAARASSGTRSSAATSTRMSSTPARCSRRSSPARRPSTRGQIRRCSRTCSRNVASASRRTLGFNNTYVLGMRADKARSLGIRRLSDLRAHRDLRYGLSNEFLSRADGWPGLQAAYGLTEAPPRGLQHELAYRAIEGGDVDVIDLYSTDAQIAQYGLVALEDDRRWFPRYDAVIVYRLGLRPDAVAALRGSRRCARRGAHGGAQCRGAARSPPGTARSRRSFSPCDPRRVGTMVAGRGCSTGRSSTSCWSASRSARRSSSPCRSGSSAFCVRSSASSCSALTGIVQTIPALALLVFMIPWFGIGAWPAIAALFLYSLLPIVRNTHLGLKGVPTDVRESAVVLGLPVLARLRLVELPLARAVDPGRHPHRRRHQHRHGHARRADRRRGVRRTDPHGHTARRYRPHSRGRRACRVARADRAVAAAAATKVGLAQLGCAVCPRPAVARASHRIRRAATVRHWRDTPRAWKSS